MCEFWPKKEQIIEPTEHIKVIHYKSDVYDIFKIINVHLIANEVRIIRFIPNILSFLK